MTTLLVARHGEADWNRERRWLGHADRPLTERGRVQAHELARRLDGALIAAAYASDLARAFDTARIALGDRAIHVTPLRELRERDYGAWDGLQDDEIPARFPRIRRTRSSWSRTAARSPSSTRWPRTSTTCGTAARSPTRRTRRSGGT